MTGLENGYYTLTGWTKNSGGQRATYLYAKGADKSESRTALPVSSQWIKVTVRGIQVNDGKMTVGIYSDAKAGNWLNLDFVELVHDNRPYKLLKGGDVSELTQIEAKGGKFKIMENVIGLSWKRQAQQKNKWMNQTYQILDCHPYEA